jgi:hypothetical protein
VDGVRAAVFVALTVAEITPVEFLVNTIVGLPPSEVRMAVSDPGV